MMTLQMIPSSSFFFGGLVCFFVLTSFKGDVFFFLAGLVCFNFSEVTPFDKTMVKNTILRGSVLSHKR